MSALKAPILDTFVREVTAEDPTKDRQVIYSEAYRRHAVQMREFTARVVEAATKDPVIINAIRMQRATVEAQRNMRAAPNRTVLMNRTRDALMKEGLTLEEAVVRASEEVRVAERAWKRDHLQEVNTILARDAQKPITLAASPAPIAKVAPPPQRFVPFGMSRSEARDEMDRPGGLPVRTGARVDEAYQRLIERTRELQATGLDYHAAYVKARTEVIDEQAAADALADTGAKAGAK